VRLWRGLAVLALLAGPAFAQDAAPLPAPLPAFHAPLAVDDSGSSGAGTDAPQATVAVQQPPQQQQATQPQARPTPQPSVPAVPQPVTLTALATDGGQPIQQGVVWRVFSAKPDAGGQLTLAAKSDSAVAKIKLAPGQYVVDAAYGRAQASDTLTVNPGSNDKSLVLDAGGLRLNAAIIGDVPIPINLLRFDILTPGQSDSDRTVVAQNLAANDIITLNAGTYHVVSYFGDVNAIVRADLKVEAGQLTDATLYHRASQISFKLVSETGGEAIADIDWTVKGSDGTTIFTNTGTFPSTVLEEGDYTVLAQRGSQVFNRDFQVQPGQPKEIEVLTTVYSPS
jgi:hypothetical protein